MAKRVAKSPLVRKLEVLTPMKEADLVALAQLEASTRRVPAGTELAAQGEPFGPVVVLRSGWAMRFKTLSDGRRQITSFAIPGDLVGLHADILSVADQSTCTLTDAEIAEFPQEQMADMFRSRPRLAMAFAWTTAREEAALAEKAACLGRRTARERLSHLLVETLRRLQMVQMAQGNRYVFPVTQELIADTLGLSAVHVNRTLSRLRAEGVVEVEGPMVHVKRLKELTEAADFDDLYLYARPMPEAVRSRLDR